MNAQKKAPAAPGAREEKTVEAKIRSLLGNKQLDFSFRAHATMPDYASIPVHFGTESRGRGVTPLVGNRVPLMSVITHITSRSAEMDTRRFRHFRKDHPDATKEEIWAKKKNLTPFWPSAVFRGRINEAKNVEALTGLFCYDLENVSKDELERLKQSPHIIILSESSSGAPNYWALLYIPGVSNFKDAWDQGEAHLKSIAPNAKSDRTNSPAPGRRIAYDPNPYVNWRAEPLPYESPIARDLKTREGWSSFVWACFAAYGDTEQGRQIIDRYSQLAPGYDKERNDAEITRLFNDFSAEKLGGTTVMTFFRRWGVKESPGRAVSGEIIEEHLSDFRKIFESGEDAFEYLNKRLGYNNEDGLIFHFGSRKFYDPVSFCERNLPGCMCEITGPDGRPKLVHAVKHWMKSPGIKQVSRVAMFPGPAYDPLTQTANAYRGPAVAPVQNDELANDWLRHVLYICRGRTQQAEVLIDIFRWTFQRVGESSRIIAFIYSLLQQVGKGVLIAPILEALGTKSSYQTSSPSDITGEFSGHLEGKALMLLEEANFAGNHQARNRLTELSGGGKIKIRKMRTDAYNVEGAIQIVAFSNFTHGAAVDWKDERYFVIDCGDLQSHAPEVVAFASRMAARKKDYAAAVLHYLLNTPIGPDLVKRAKEFSDSKEPMQQESDKLGFRSFMLNMEKQMPEFEGGETGYNTKAVFEDGGKLFVRTGIIARAYESWCGTGRMQRSSNPQISQVYTALGFGPSVKKAGVKSRQLPPDWSAGIGEAFFCPDGTLSYNFYGD